VDSLAAGVSKSRAKKTSSRVISRVNKVSKGRVEASKRAGRSGALVGAHERGPAAGPAAPAAGFAPAGGAPVLIVSLGLLTKPSEMVMIMVGVVILTVAGLAINWAFGISVPLWSGRD